MSKIEDVKDIMSDVRSAIRDMERASSALEDCAFDLGKIELEGVSWDFGEDLMVEVLMAGLPLIEARYGLSSKESQDIRKYVAELTKK